MSKSFGSLLRFVVCSAIALSCICIATGQGTEDLPHQWQTKEYQMLGVPPVDIEPVQSPTDGNPGGSLGPPGVPQIPAISVPEPTTTVLLLAGAGVLAGMALRRKRH